MEQNPIRIAEILLGLKDVNLIGVEDLGNEDSKTPLRVHIECLGERPKCPVCNGMSYSKGGSLVELIDLQSFGRPVRLIWHKRRWVCKDETCIAPSWSDVDTRIAAPRLKLTDRAARFATRVVGRDGRSVSSVARELDCDWHTINDAVIAYGTPLVEDPNRFGKVRALGLDETLFYREGRYRTQKWSTSIVDVMSATLLDVVPGKGGAEPKKWIASQPREWRDDIKWGTLDLAGSYRAVFKEALPNAVLVADPFHLIKLANTRLDETRRRVQQNILGHRGRGGDPLYRIRRLLNMAKEKLTEGANDKLTRFLEAGDPDNEVATSWRAKESLRELYTYRDPDLARDHLDALISDFTDNQRPPEVQLLGRTLKSWHDEILAWHRSFVTNGPTESMNNLIKRIKRIAFGMTNFANFRIRALLSAGKPDWSLLDTVTPVTTQLSSALGS
ncbi:ISL3 family transposase [Ferrimicrobium acidiphilum]|uniref:ISL3 family transposase n=2 Tax=Ferrimicrobium acidiphilum TaxID=121039 RepID=UPI0023F1C6BB|nr:ISL3 family transposase [Ferrimicrobium acidiphilum]